MAILVIHNQNGYAVTITDELTIFKISHYLEEISSQCMDAAELAFDLSQIEEIDACGVQLLCALKKHQDRHDGIFAINKWSEAVENALELHHLHHFLSATGDT